jgi:pilus assembly protein Flp/PilA
MKNFLGGLSELSLNAASIKREFNWAPDALLKCSLGIRNFLNQDEAQDLVEYALVVALIAFGATTAMKGLSTEIKTAFSTISSDLGSSL